MVEVEFPLVTARALHFAASVSACGVVFFWIFVAGRAIGAIAGYSARDVKEFYARLHLIFWISLVLAFISGVAWFSCVAAEIGDRPAREIFSDDIAWTVLSGTTFGRVWIARLVIGALLAAAVWSQSREQKPIWCSLVQVLLAAGFVASLAWAGHAAATPGLQGDIHLVSDILHLIAVGAWVGGLLPYILLLKTFRHRKATGSELAIITATQRFSNLGILAVGTIVVTGVVNTWNLVGSVGALIGTDYGRLLLVKIGLFLVMVGFATINRLRLSPRLATDDATSKLERNSLIEAGLGLIVLFVIGVLGTLPPAIHDYAGHMH
jgi:copper resistance protein D